MAQQISVNRVLSTFEDMRGLGGYGVTSCMVNKRGCIYFANQNPFCIHVRMEFKKWLAGECVMPNKYPVSHMKYCKLLSPVVANATQTLSPHQNPDAAGRFSIPAEGHSACGRGVWRSHPGPAAGKAMRVTLKRWRS